MEGWIITKFDTSIALLRAYNSLVDTRFAIGTCNWFINLFYDRCEQAPQVHTAKLMPRLGKLKIYSENIINSVYNQLFLKLASLRTKSVRKVYWVLLDVRSTESLLCEFMTTELNFFLFLLGTQV